MSSPRPVALQLAPFSKYLESALNARFEIVRWWELDGAAQRAWLASHAGSVRAIATGAQFGCPNELMASLPALGIVSVNGVGIDRVDLAVARSRGVRVGNTPGAPTIDTADLAVGLVISLLRGLPAADAYVRAGRWPQGDLPLTRRVTGCVFGIVGLGSIGSAVAARLAPFGPDRVHRSEPQARRLCVRARSARAREAVGRARRHLPRECRDTSSDRHRGVCRARPRRAISSTSRADPSWTMRR